jgi:diguanylate cyclase (GGDEF)-like protein
MASDRLDSIRHQTRFVLHVVERDIFKRVATTAMMIGIFCWLEQYLFAISLIILLPPFEVGAAIAVRNLPKEDADISQRFIAFVWFLQIGSTLVYLSPAFHLTLEGSTPMFLAAFLWLSGIFVHITNTFFSMPFYNWTLMLPSFAAAFGVLWMAAAMEQNPETRSQWFVAMTMLVVYVFNTFETLHKQTDTQRALDGARKEANNRLKELERLTRHDSLTGLLNRRGFDLSLAELLGRKDPFQTVAVFLLDLDGFKPINDTYSHEAGDKVLQTVGGRLAELVKGRGFAARFGGDEFAIVLAGASVEGEIMEFGKRIVMSIQQPIQHGARLLQVSASVGVSLTSRGLRTVGNLCTAADQAMYRAKGNVGNKVVLYEAQSFARRTSLEDRNVLLAAMERGEIRPFYQPKVDLRSGAVYGHEALARWVRPDRGIIPPSAFLPQINELGLQGDFLLYTAKQVLQDIDTLIAEGLFPGDISVNVPEIALGTRTGRKDFQKLLDQHPAARLQLTLEITEDVFIQRATETIMDSIARFRMMGLRVSLDDFGTGFASFQHLRQLEFDELKIDSSFLRGLGSDKRAEVVVSGFLSMAAGLGVSVVAEGIETAGQLSILQRLGCPHGQGFYFGRADSFEETRSRIRADAVRRQAEREMPRQA